MTTKYDAVDVAKERFEKFLENKFSDNNFWMEEKWKYYTHLLDQAKKFVITDTGFCPNGYKEDEAEAKRRNAAIPEPENTFHLPEREKRQSRHF